MHPTPSSHACADSLVLDIGGAIGALVIHTDAGRNGAEIEISPTSDPAARRSHNVVHAHHNRHGVQHSAVFPDVTEGTYTVWADATTPHGTVTVHGGQVSDYDLTQPAPIAGH